jgi:hypothetical protein
MLVGVSRGITERAGMRVTRAWGITLLLATLGQVSCDSKPEYNVNLVFPSQALMLATSCVQVLVLEQKGSGDPCASFMRGSDPDSQFPTVFSAAPSFPFGAGDISTQGLSFGAYAFVAEAWNKSDQRFLRGCTLAQLDRSASRVIAVQLTELRGCCRPSDPSCSSGADLPCYDGASATLGKGACKAGSAPCKVGTFTTCVGQVLPLEESCNRLDDDCDGQVDNVAADTLASDPKNCGRCEVVCPLGCTNGICDRPADGGVDVSRLDAPKLDALKPDRAVCRREDESCGQSDVHCCPGLTCCSYYVPPEGQYSFCGTSCE